eukprot:3939035-Rhodomonas_salina.4
MPGADEVHGTVCGAAIGAPQDHLPQWKTAVGAASKFRCLHLAFCNSALTKHEVRLDLAAHPLEDPRRGKSANPADPGAEAVGLRQSRDSCGCGNELAVRDDRAVLRRRKSGAGQSGVC